MITVRIAHAEPGPGRLADTGPRIDPRVPVAARLSGFHVVLADDAGHRALRAWLAQDPDGTRLPALLDRPGDDIWTTRGIPEELAVRLMSAAGGTVTGVEIHPDRKDIEEVTEQTCTARIQLGGPSGTRHVTARLDLGLTLAVVSGAHVLVPNAVMDRLAMPVTDGDVLAAFREPGPPRTEREPIFMVDRRAGRVFQVHGGLGGQRPRFEPRNMDFGDGLDRWDLDSSARDLDSSARDLDSSARDLDFSARDLVEEAAAQARDDYSAAAEGGSAVLASASEEPRGSALLAQTIFADDYRGAPVAFGGEIRAEDVAGQVGLRLEILRKGWRIEADRRVERTVGVAGGQDWSRREITVTVPEDTDVIRFGITLAGRGRVWLRHPELRPHPELRRERPRDAGSGDVG